MKRGIDMVYEGHQVHLGYSTKCQHYRVSLDGVAIGWVVPRLFGAYNNEGEYLGMFKNIECAAEAVAEHHVYFS